MYSYVETESKQYRGLSGQSIVMDRTDSEPGTEVALDKVVIGAKKDGAVFDTPYV